MTSFLIVDDDKAFCEALKNSFTRRGFEVEVANNGIEAVEITRKFNPEWILLDLKMPETSGLELIPKMMEIDSQTSIVVLTGYANISTAVEAIKLGAIHYLSKPVSTDDIIEAFNKKSGDPNAPVETESMKLNVAEREHILSAFERNQRNISATARELGMHRRTLQRKLDKIR